MSPDLRLQRGTAPLRNEGDEWHVIDIEKLPRLARSPLIFLRHDLSRLRFGSESQHLPKKNPSRQMAQSLLKIQLARCTLPAARNFPGPACSAQCPRSSRVPNPTWSDRAGSVPQSHLASAASSQQPAASSVDRGHYRHQHVYAITLSFPHHQDLRPHHQSRYPTAQHTHPYVAHSIVTNLQPATSSATFHASLATRSQNPRTPPYRIHLNLDLAQSTCGPPHCSS